MNIAIEQIQHGNEQAFKSLFDEYYQGLCVFASAYLKDDDLSADVVQEAFVKFWNRRRDFDHIVKIKSFLYTIVRNDCLNIVQRQKVVLEDVSVFENSGFFHDKLIEDRELSHLLCRYRNTFSSRKRGDSIGFGWLEKQRDSRSIGDC